MDADASLLVLTGCSFVVAYGLTSNQRQLPITNNVGRLCSLLIACLLISVVRDGLICRHVGLLWLLFYSCRWLINTFALMFPLHRCHPVILITSMSPHSIQSTMSSRSITIAPSGRSTGLDYSGNLLVLIPISLFFMSLIGFKLIFTTFFVSRVEDAWHSSLLTAQSPSGGRQGVRHRLHP